jgi:regulatory protein
MPFGPKKKLKDPSSVSHGYEYCIFLLSLRLRTEGELRDKMRERGYESQVIDSVLKQLVSQKYIDDVRYASVFVENLKQYKPYGYMKIKQKLMQKRLSMDVIEQTLDELLSLEDEQKIAERYLKKEYSTVDKEKLKQEEKQKIAQRLQARGFRGQVISKLIF